jgi:hydroxymethylpyrimidine pyrophosphatase-like HAD family hydrolase
MNARVGNRSSDFYFKYTSDGKKLYYSRITGKLVPKKQIPESIIDKIEELNEDRDLLTLVNLVSQRDALQNKIESLRKKLENVELKIEENQVKKGNIRSNGNYENLIQNDINNYQRHKSDQDAKTRERIQQYNEEEVLRNRFKSSSGNNSSSNQNSSKMDFTLQDLGIVTKKQWHKWLVNNHPDKGGNKDLCIQVIAAGRKKGW